jgi:acetyl esterase/lipase
MRTPLLISVALLAIVTASVAQTTTLPLWPSGTPSRVPGDRNVAAGQTETDTTTPADALIAGKRVERLGFVSTPTLTLYRPDEGKANGAAIVVLPGGSYKILAYDLEGTEVCTWLNSIGVACALLKYRVPNGGPYPMHTQDLADAQRAVRLVREHTSEWHLDPKRIGVLGFSAGAHLAAVLGTHPAESSYPAADAADQLSARPDFSLLIYPAYMVQEGDQQSKSDRLASEVQPVALTPPTFLIQAEDDPIKVENALHYYEALKQVDVSAEMHLYAHGGHGFGLRPTRLPITHWPDLAAAWMHALGVTP